MIRLGLVVAYVIGLSAVGLAADDKPVPVKLTDEEVTKLLNSVWVWEDTAVGSEAKLVLHEDGTFIRVDRMNKTLKVAVMKGNWEVTKGVLVLTASSTDDALKGVAMKGTITAIDEKKHTIVMYDGTPVNRTKRAELKK